LPRRWLALCVLVASTAAAQEKEKPEDAEFYTVKSGDTCQSVSRKAWPDDRNALDRLHQLNAWLGPREPHYLKPGMRLAISATAPDARITSLRPHVNAKKSGRRSWEEAQRGRALYRLDQVNTLDDANALVTFRDGSALYLDQRALVVIYGVYVGKKQRQKTGAVELVQGDMRLKLQSLRGEGARVDTPVASVAPESRELAVGVGKDKTVRISVFDGKATVAGKGKKVTVEQGFGTRVEQGKPPEQPQPVPPSPGWDAPGIRDVWVAGADGTASPEIAWKAADGAEMYKLEVARDEGFGERLRVESRAAGGAQRETLAGLGPGRYFARVSGVNGAGLLGMPSAARIIDVVRVKADNGPSPGCAATGEVRVAFEGPVELDVYVDGKPAASPLIVRGVGAHSLKLAPGADPGRAAVAACEVLVPRARIALERLGDGVQAVVSLTDAAGDAIAVDASELTLVGKEGTQTSPLRREGSTWRGGVVPFEGEREKGVKLVALWAGTPIGELTEVEAVSRPVPPPPPRRVALAYPVGQPATTVELAPPPSPEAPRPFVVGMRIEPSPSTPVGVSDGVRFALDGELGFGPLGVYASATLENSAELAAGGQSARSVTAGGRYRLARGVDVYADATIPIDPTYVSGRGGAQLALELDRLTFATAQSAMVSRGGGVEETAWVSSYLAGWHIVDKAALVLGAEAVVGTTRLGDTRAVALAAGVRARVGMFEAGFAARMGMGDDAKQIFGVLALLFSIEVRP
jgi:hypothetical protein